MTTFFNVVSICNIIFKENSVPVGVHFTLHLACADYWIHVLCLSTSFTLIFGEVLVAGKAFLLLPSLSYFMSVKTVYWTTLTIIKICDRYALFFCEKLARVEMSVFRLICSAIFMHSQWSNLQQVLVAYLYV